MASKTSCLQVLKNIFFFFFLLAFFPLLLSPNAQSSYNPLKLVHHFGCFSKTRPAKLRHKNEPPLTLACFSKPRLTPGSNWWMCAQLKPEVRAVIFTSFSEQFLGMFLTSLPWSTAGPGTGKPSRLASSAAWQGKSLVPRSGDLRRLCSHKNLSLSASLIYPVPGGKVFSANMKLVYILRALE